MEDSVTGLGTTALVDEIISDALQKMESIKSYVETRAVLNDPIKGNSPKDTHVISEIQGAITTTTLEFSCTVDVCHV